MTPSSVCFGARDDSPGMFQVPTGGQIITFRLVHVSGSVSCSLPYYTHWGCDFGLVPPAMAVYVTDNGKRRLLPRDLRWFSQAGSIVPCSNGLFYNLPWAYVNSPELLFDNFSPPLSVTIGQQFQIWHAEDLVNCLDFDNSGQTCARVYALFV